MGTTDRILSDTALSFGNPLLHSLSIFLDILRITLVAGQTALVVGRWVATYL